MRVCVGVYVCINRRLDTEGRGENGNLFTVKTFPGGAEGCGTEKMKRAHQGTCVRVLVGVHACACVCVYV